MRQEPYNAIRKKIRKLIKREAIYPCGVEFGYGYHAAMKDALKVIKDVKKQFSKE